MLGRRRKPPDPLAHVDPAAVPARLATIVAEAVEARRRWQATAEALAAGPLSERIAALGAQVDEGVLAIWTAVSRIAALQAATSAVDVEAVTARYKQAKRDPAAAPELLAALEAQHSSTHRLLNALDDAEARLRLLDARLDAAVARATELALTRSADRRADDGGLGEVIAELQALEASLDELGA